MPRLPLDLRVDSVFGTPQNSPVVVLPREVGGPQQLPMQGIEPEFSQFQRARKLQFTGRGMHVGIHYVRSPQAADTVWIYCTPPIPFRALLRNLYYWSATKTGTWFIPFVTDTDLTGLRNLVDVPNVQNLVMGYTGTNIPKGALVEYAAMGQQVAPLNYLCAHLGTRVGVIMVGDAQSNYYSHYVFEALEVADER
jgi:hypothetical protein